MLKSIKQYIKKNNLPYAFLYLIILSLLFFPKAITMPSISFRGAIVTAIGLDKINEEIEVSALTLSDISKDNMGENTKVISGKNETLANAINALESQIGRTLKMGHVGYVVISSSFKNENIAKILNTLAITTKMPKSISLVISENNAKEILTRANKLEKSSMYKLREIIQNEFNTNYTKDTSLDNFLKGYFSDISVSTLGYIKLENNISEGINSNSVNKKEDITENKNSQNDVISIKRQQAVFVNGIMKYILKVEEMKGINWVVENDLQHLFTIKDVTEQGLQNAYITFNVLSNKIKPNVEYRNNIPTITFNLDLKLNMVEVKQKNEQKMSPKEIRLTKGINEKINEKIKSDFLISLNKLRNEKTDVIGAYKILMANNNNKFEAFLDFLPNKNDFLSFVNFKIKVFSKLVNS